MSFDPSKETRELRDVSQAGAQLTLPGIKLTVIEGPDRGKEAIARRGSLKVGTAEDNDLIVGDDAVSRRHFEVRLRGDEVRVVDLSSTNGTWIDGIKIIEAILSPGSLIRAGSTAIRAGAVEEPVIVPLSSKTAFGGLLGQSSAMRQVFGIFERAALTDATILVEGETGTGKEVAAEAIHQSSLRREGPFVAIDCGAIAASLVESELFGHVKGAYTGAIADRRGVFEEADCGTLFLDEIGELPLELQPKLLRALETRTIRRVGETQTRKVDVRIVAATNRDLAAAVNRGTFREDLYFRLAVVQVRLPPLRTRREDIPILVRHFVERFAPGSVPPSNEMMQALAAKPWPGNVRELRNAVERALALSAPASRSGTAEPETNTLEAAMAPLLQMPLKDAVEEWSARFERVYLTNAMRIAGDSVSETARMSGVNRRFVQRMMKRLGMREAQLDDEDD